MSAVGTQTIPTGVSTVPKVDPNVISGSMQKINEWNPPEACTDMSQEEGEEESENSSNVKHSFTQNALMCGCLLSLPL